MGFAARLILRFILVTVGDEILAELFEEAFTVRTHIGMLDFGKLAEHFLVPWREDFGGFDVHLNQQVAFATPARVGHAAAA